MTKITSSIRRPAAAAVDDDAGCRCVFCCIERLPFGTTLARHATRIAARRLGKVDGTSVLAEIAGEQS